MTQRSEATEVEVDPGSAPTVIDYRYAELTVVSSNISLLGRGAAEETVIDRGSWRKPKVSLFSLLATKPLALGLLLATMMTSLSCGLGTVTARCAGPQCLSENEHALTCAPTPAPSPFEDHDPVPPPDPIECRPPEHNPGGVNGTRSERRPESDSRLAR